VAHDLVDVKPFPDKASRRSFTGESLEAERIALRYVTRGPGGPLSALVRFGAGSEGAPKRVHGGAVLTVLDEAMGAACWVKGVPVLTARLSAAFRRGVPLEADLTVETAIVRETSRLIFVSGRLVDGAGGVYAEAEGSFARLRPDQVKATFGDPPSF
jgi:acyl-coenzyme A thioesterase PaaI-like protein